jgi:hypothetical protein
MFNAPQLIEAQVFTEIPTARSVRHSCLTAWFRVQPALTVGRI